MPRLDNCHIHVVRALEKVGYAVALRPYQLILSRGHTLHIDIEAHLNKQTIMVVEVKCFDDPNKQTTELYTALGQYFVYKSLLEEFGLEFPLYLAVPVHAYEGIFQRMALPVIQRNAVKIMVVDMVNEVIEQWVN